VGTAAVLVVVATVGIWMLNERPSPTPTAGRVTDEQADALADLPAEADAEAPVDTAVPDPALPPSDDLITQAAPPAAPSPGQAASSGLRNMVPRPTPPRPSAETAVEAEVGAREDDRSSGALASRAAADEAAAPTAVWEAGEDVRLLSLRLQQLTETSEGLGWDTPPVPFGAAGEPARNQLEGVQPVRADAEPARVEVRMRTTPSVRSNRQPPR
jgi:hypothetical protein